jgi:hypothetical protein
MSNESMSNESMSNERMSNEERKKLMHPLDNIIWQALTTRQADFAQTFQSARRFMREVTSLAALPDLSAQSFQSLAGLTGPGGTTALFLEDPFQSRPGWKIVAGAPMLEMV